MNRKGLRHYVLIAEGGQPPASMITGNDGFPLHVAGTCQVGQLPRQRGEAETPTSNQPPRGTQGRRLLGLAALRTCPFASLLSQVRARLGPGGYYGRSGNGGPQTCLPAACGVAQVGGPMQPSFISLSSRPSRGAKPRGADDRKLPQEQPPQAGSRGGGEIKAGYLPRFP